MQGRMVYSRICPSIKKYVDSNSWVFATLEYTHKFEINISVNRGLVKEKQRCDMAIMKKALEYSSSVSDLRPLSRIKLCFQVYSISEIYSANGNEC